MRVGIRTNKPEFLERLRGVLPPGSKTARSPVVDRLFSVIVGGEGPRPNVRRYNLLYQDATKLSRTMEIDEVLEKLERRLQVFIAERARRRVFVHAGVVGWKGRGIVISGCSLSGKSTLVRELVRAGATYYSDEYAVLDSRGWVHPFSKPLKLSEEPAFRQTEFPLERLNARIGVKPLPVGLVILSEYQAGANWRPRRLSPGRAALGLLTFTAPARRDPEAALGTMRELVSYAPVVKGVRGEAKDTVASIFQMLRD